MLATQTNVTVKSKLQHPPPPPGIPRAFDAFSCPGGREFDHHSLGVGNLIASLDVMLRVALIPRGLINHGGDVKGKDSVFVADCQLKTKGLHKLCSLFEGV